MRKINFLAVVLFVAIAGSAVAQPGNAIKINLLSPVARTFNIAYERKVSDNGSFQLGFYYTGAKSGDLKLSGFGITPEYRFYLSQTPAPNGFYVAPFMRYTSYDLTYNNGTDKASGSVTSFGGGLVVGRQWVFKERVTLDMFIGPKYQSRNAKTTSGNSSDLTINA